MNTIRFIHPSDNIFDRPAFRTYLLQLDRHEYNAKTGKSTPLLTDLITAYQTAVLTWSVGETDMITNVIKQADRYCHDFIALRSIPWKLVKWNPKLEWGMPFTLHDTIFIPTSHLNKPPFELMRTLIHEKIHIDQRQRQSNYSTLYETSLGWQYVPDMVFPPQIYSQMIHNPDGMDRRWIFRPDNIVMLLTMSGQSVQETFYHWPDFKRIHTGSIGLRRIYGTDDHLYHPNEMTAHILANWICGTRYPNSPELVEMIHFAESF